MNTWIFQGNPKQFDVDEYVKNNKIVTWGAKIYQKEMQMGDRGFIWRADGKNKNSGGIMASCVVHTEPYFDKSEDRMVIDLKVEEYRLTEEEGMLLRIDLKENVKTRFLNIIRQANGTNFKCNNEEAMYLEEFWKDPNSLKAENRNSYLVQYLNLYRPLAKEHLKDLKYVEDSLEFFQAFKEKDKLSTLEWKDIQEIGNHVNALRMGIARSRALGQPNGSIEKYRKSFMYLFHGKGSLEERIDTFLLDPNYELFGLGKSVVSEILGNVFPEELCFYNQRDIKAVEEILNIKPNYMRGDTFGKRYSKFQQTLIEHDVVDMYKKHIGQLSNLPIYLEIDQFFSFLYDKYASYLKSERNDKESIYEEVLTERLGDEVRESIPDIQSQSMIQEFTIDNFLENVFLDRYEVEEMIGLLDYKNNIILQGPPGVGKTFIAKQLAYLHSGKKDVTKINMVQFHQSYSYEEFIRGFKPDEEGKFRLADGIFYELCKKAKADKQNNYYMIIDEINRGNISKIFGELLMLIEKDKRGYEYSVTLPYAKENEEKFYIPNNIYIIGMMNTADRSLAVVDYALRRRFAFIDIEPAFHKTRFKTYLEAKSMSEELIYEIIQTITDINKVIEEDDIALGKGYRIGHSYFCNYDGSDEKTWFNRIIKYEIKPLLDEYWFDDKDKVRDIIAKFKEYSR